MKYTVVLAIFLGLASAEESTFALAENKPVYTAQIQESESESESDSESDSSSDSSSDSEDEAAEDQQNVQVEETIPDRFSRDSDDLFMRSVFSNYASGEWLSKSGAKALAREVLSTHKGLKGSALNEYLATYFNKAWGHFDVNRVGKIEALKADNFIRFLASDQYFQF